MARGSARQQDQHGLLQRPVVLHRYVVDPARSGWPVRTPPSPPAARSATRSPSRTVKKEGKVIYQHQDQAKSAFPAAVANNVTDVLKTVVDKGTGTNAKLTGRRGGGQDRYHRRQQVGMVRRLHPAVLDRRRHVPARRQRDQQEARVPGDVRNRRPGEDPRCVVPVRPSGTTTWSRRSATPLPRPSRPPRRSVTRSTAAACRPAPPPFRLPEHRDPRRPRPPSPPAPRRLSPVPESQQLLQQVGLDAATTRVAPIRARRTAERTAGRSPSPTPTRSKPGNGPGRLDRQDPTARSRPTEDEGWCFT